MTLVGESQQVLETLIRRAAEPVLGYFKVPGLVVAWARGAESPQYFVVGTDYAQKPLATDSLFPVASISKLATALAVLRLVDANQLTLDEPLARYLPDAAAAQPGVTLRTLLSHASGLPYDIAPERAPYAEGLNWPMLARACLNTPLERPPHTRVTYSNVGYGLLALAVERATWQNFSDALNMLVLKPLDIEGYLGTEPPRPTIVLGDVRSEHVHTPLEPYNTSFWRNIIFPWGGLVTTAEGALRLVRAFNGTPRDFLSPARCADAIHNQADDLPGGYGVPFIYPRSPWGLGPDLKDAKKPHWTPAEASAETFGHAGASGGVAWCDPVHDIAWAILGSRTADNGWLLRGSPSIGSALLNAR